MPWYQGIIFRRERTALLLTFPPIAQKVPEFCGCERTKPAIDVEVRDVEAALYEEWL